MKPLTKKALIYGVLFTIISIAIEVLFFTFGFTLEKHAGLMGVTLLIIAPLISAHLAGFRRPKEFLIIYFFTILFTLILVAFFGQITEGGVFGPATTIIKPILIRLPSAFMAVLVAHRLIRV